MKINLLKFIFTVGYITLIACAACLIIAAAINHYQALYLLVALVLGYVLHLILDKAMKLLPVAVYSSIIVSLVVISLLIACYWFKVETPMLFHQIPDDILNDGQLIVAYQNDLWLTGVLGFCMSFAMHWEELLD